MSLMKSIVLLSLLWAPFSLSLQARSPGAGNGATGQVLFIENVGQFAPGARFQVWNGGQPLWLAENGIWWSIFDHSQGGASESFILGDTGQQRERASAAGINLRLSFPGANTQPAIEPLERLAARVSYFTGNDPAGWHTDVPVWGGVRYRDLYPGVDLELRGEGGRLVQRFIVRPGADTSAVRVEVAGAAVTGVTGRMLTLNTPTGAFVLPLPQADFPLAVAGETESGVKAAWVIKTGVEAPLRAEPSSLQANGPTGLLFSTFLGGNGPDDGTDISVDAAGSIYVTGNTFSGDFPTTPGAFDQTPWLVCNGEGCPEAFVAKLNPAGDGLVYATFLGGRGWENSHAIAVDAAGHAYVTGQTNAPDFPVTPGAFDPTFNWAYCIFDLCPDTFVVKLNPTGTGLLYSTYVGGAVGGAGGPGGAERGSDIAVDSAGSAYVTGDTSSSDFPTTPGAFDRTLNTEWCAQYYNPCYDGYVFKLNPAGSALVYATFLGGARDETPGAITVDGAGSAYVTGFTFGDDFPTTPGAFDTSFNNSMDAFVVKLNPAGSGLVYATYLGGSDREGSHDIALDAAGSAYVTGYTYSGDFPVTPGAWDGSFNGKTDAFVAKLNPDGSALAYATYVGGKGTQFTNGYDGGTSIAVDSVGNAFVGGDTTSSDFPVTTGAFDLSLGGYKDIFLVKVNPEGSRLDYATFLGGAGAEEGAAIVADDAGRVHVTGTTDSSDFPVTSGAFAPDYQGGYTDAFVARLLMERAHRYAGWLPMIVNGP